MYARARTYSRPVLGLAVAALAMVMIGGGSQSSADAVTTGPDCGPTILKVDGRTPWKCTFEDDFDGTSLDGTKWVPQLTSTSGYHSGQECFVNTPDNIAVTDGELRLTALKTKAPFYCSGPGVNYATQVTSGMVSTYQRFTQARGRFEVRAKFPGSTTSGVQSSLWMWPEKLEGGWPYSGEIDVAEWYSQYPDRVIPYVHYWYDGWDSTVTNNNCIVKNVADWHTYTVEWTTTAIEIKYDDKTCIKTSAWANYRLYGYAPYDKPFMIAITQMLGMGNNVPNALTLLPATTSVDYVRVWS